MTKKMFVLAILASLLVLAGMAAAADLVHMKQMPARQAILTGDEPLPDVAYYPGGNIATDAELVGYTQYDYQSNGSTGHRIVVDSQGNIHIAWMKGMPYPSVRRIYFNCKTSTGWTSPGTGSQVDYGTQGAGYVQLATTSDDRSLINYHKAPTGAESLFVAIDAFTCLSSFEYRRPPNRIGGRTLLWPYITTDRTGRIHVVATHNAATGASQVFGYTRSTDVGVTWSAVATVDTLEVISPIVVASRVSDKVAIVYNHAIDTASQWKNDIYYVQSTDGTSWDFRNNKVNVTHYGQGGDSLYAYTDVSALYDYNDNLHLLWNAQYVTTGIYYSSKLLHYDVTSGTVHQIAQFDSVWPSSGCDFGAWNWGFAKMSLAVDPQNNIYAAYTSWDTSDCSQGGYANGDIYLNYSTDHGATWSQRINMTNSQSPACAPGDCDSDHWSCLAEKVDTTLHLFFINDKDAGGVVQTEGSITDNPVMYYPFTKPTAIHDDINVPVGFSLAQNYPNPFNAQTNIDFVLDKSAHVSLSVYDITGAKVATLYDGRMDAGAHQINWDASRISSGVYYYTLRANGSEMTKKMTLLK